MISKIQFLKKFLEPLLRSPRLNLNIDCHSTLEGQKGFRDFFLKITFLKSVCSTKKMRKVTAFFSKFYLNLFIDKVCNGTRCVISIIYCLVNKRTLWEVLNKKYCLKFCLKLFSSSRGEQNFLLSTKAIGKTRIFLD